MAIRGFDSWLTRIPKGPPECRKCLAAPKWIDEMGRQACSVCRGTRWVEVKEKRIGFTISWKFKCEECEDGTENCSRCEGTGLENECTGRWKTCGCDMCDGRGDWEYDAARDRKLLEDPGP
jgi:hypothetical protein